MPNRFEFPDPDPDVPLDPSWTDSLSAAASALWELEPLPSDQFFEPRDFDVVARVRRSSLPDVVLYEHAFTRRFLIVDASGRAYRHLPPKRLGDTEPGRFLAHRDLRRAVAELQLWELPWMKPELYWFTKGIGWSDHRVLFDYRTRDLRTDLPDREMSVREVEQWGYPDDDLDGRQDLDDLDDVEWVAP